MADAVDSEPDLDNFLKKSFLSLEKIEENIFRSTYLWHPVYSRSVYGGQLIGQALVAATKTVPEERFAHSLHCYFLNPGSGDHPVVYHVDRTRDGRTYASRTVTAAQRGKMVLTMQASFKKEESDPFSHQMKMSDVVDPEDLLNTEELMKLAIENPSIPEATKKSMTLFLNEQMPIELRPVNPYQHARQQPQKPVSRVWIRASGHIGDDMSMHKCAAAYMSDVMLLSVITMPAGSSIDINMTSLDHSIWFHNPFHANEWMLYEMESPFCGDAHGLCQGRLWRRDGVLAMSITQEGAIRSNPPSKL